ncbi:MAG TPA: hypothetical protein VHP32_03500 [Ignavibacteria bacterium]|nr:hypothetical protein [Ignavibacteria bacterium]
MPFNMEELVLVYETYNYNEAMIIKAKLESESIDFKITGASPYFLTMEGVNSELGRMALKQPIKFFVLPKFYEIAKVLINTDNSQLLDEDYEY